MINVDHADLSAGLNVVAYRHDGNLTIRVSRNIPALQRRAAVHTAMRAARRAGWIQYHGMTAAILAPALWIARKAIHFGAVKTGVLASSVAGLTAAAIVLLPSPHPAHIYGALPPPPRVAPARVSPLHSTPAPGNQPVPQPQPQPAPGVLPNQAPALTADGQASAPPGLPSISVSITIGGSPSPATSPSQPPPGNGVCLKFILHICLG